ncbi:hypothetical protein [Flavobacterium sp. JP2137]|uniref:hypothetical protein n=1 Tax=Flavobacterium sp. JP2137 TaxID=3414510 RepID=UPI003D2FDE22
MSATTPDGSSKKRLIASGIALLLILVTGLLYLVINNKEEAVIDEHITPVNVESETAVETEKALQLLSTQVNKGLDSIKNNDYEN